MALKKPFQIFGQRVYSFLVHKWFFTALILTLPAIYSGFLTIFAKKWGFIDSDGKPTDIGIIVSIFVFVAQITIASMKSYADKKNELRKSDGQYYLLHLNSAFNSALGNKKQRCVDAVGRLKRRIKQRPIHFSDVYDPKQQIKVLINSMWEALSRIYDIVRENIGIMIFYRTDKKSKWGLLVDNGVDDVAPTNLLQNDYSTVCQIINEHTTQVFFADKQVGKDENQYHSIPRDKTFGNTGSILTKLVTPDPNSGTVEAILRINTYGTRFCDTSDEEARKKLEILFLQGFEYRLKLELTLLYISEALS